MHSQPKFFFSTFSRNLVIVTSLLVSLNVARYRDGAYRANQTKGSATMCKWMRLSLFLLTFLGSQTVSIAMNVASAQVIGQTTDHSATMEIHLGDGGRQSVIIPTAMTISAVNMWLSPNSGDNSDHSASYLAIYADNGGGPGAQIATSSVLSIDASISTTQSYPYIFSSPVTLQAGTYWLEPTYSSGNETTVYGSIGNPYSGGVWFYPPDDGQYSSIEDAYFLLSGIFPDQPRMDQADVSITGDHQQIGLGIGYSGTVTSATVRIGFPNTNPSPTYNLRFVVCHDPDGSSSSFCTYPYGGGAPPVIDGMGTATIIQDNQDHDYTFTFSPSISLDPTFDYEFAFCAKLATSTSQGCDFPDVPFDWFRAYKTSLANCPFQPNPIVNQGSCWEVLWNTTSSSAPAVPPNIGLPGGGGAGDNLNQVGIFAEPVSTNNGNYYYRHTDFAIPARGMPLAFERSYNTLDNYSGPLGANWTHSYNVILIPTASGVTIKFGDGHGETFTFNGTSYVPQPGVFNTLAQNGDGTFTLTRKDQTRYNFTAAGKLASIVDKNGNTIALSYDGSGNLTKIADAVGRVLTLTYDSNNRIAKITDPTGRTELFSYSANNDLAQATDPAGGVTTYAYDGSHRVTSIVLPNGNALLQNAYDSQGRVASQTNGRGFTTTFAYDTPSTGETTITDPFGNKTVHTYDSSLRIVDITNALGGTVKYAYDSNNDRTSVTNQSGNTTNFSYDAEGNVTQITDPLANTSSFTYDAKNDLLTAKNPLGRTTTFSYDTHGNLTSIHDALGNTTTFAYDGFGELTSKTDANGNATTFSYDPLGDLAVITDALGNQTYLGYDANSRLTSVTDANGHTAGAAYDALSRLTNIGDPLGDQTRFAYDSVGNLVSITDANSHVTQYGYDAVNNLTNATDALGRLTQYAYDANNNRTAFTNANDNTTSCSYDKLNRLVSIADPLGFVTSYAYDPVGNVVATTDAKGKTNGFAYDALNRLTAISYADGNNVNYAYDANGNRTSMTDSHGTTSYAYDALDRLTSVTNPGAVVVAYTYDSVGNRASVTYPDGKVVAYSYDGASRLARVTDWLGRVTNYNYDPASNLLNMSYPNGASVGFQYDPANRLVQVLNTYRGSTGNPISSFTYTLDPVGNRLLVADGSGKVTSYGYDSLNELTSVTVADKLTSFSYDPVGNRLSLAAPGTLVSYSYDADDRLTSSSIATFTYDANGNETGINPAVDPPAARANRLVSGHGLRRHRRRRRRRFSALAAAQVPPPITYVYDAANRLSRASGPSGVSAFSYDGDGTRLLQSVGAASYSYVNDVATPLTEVLQEYGPDGKVQYVYGLGRVSESGSGFDFWYLYDGLGSVVGLTDGNGKLAGRYVYDAWGNATLTAPAPQLGTKNKFRFAGEALDPGTGLYYLRARYYDPSAARFSTPDRSTSQLSFPLSTNRYLYGLSNPLRFLDPSGTTPAEVARTMEQNTANISESLSSLVTEVKENAGRLLDALFSALILEPAHLSTPAGLIKVGVGISGIQSQEQHAGQFEAAVSACVGQVASGTGGHPNSVSGVHDCVQSDYPYIGPRVSDDLICSIARTEDPSIQGCSQK
jgi:RHS repeat-associated protein